MNTVLRALCLALVALGSSACAGAGSARSSYPHSADAADFGIRVLVVAGKADFLRDWDKPSPPPIEIINQVHSGAPFSIAVLYWGGGADQVDHCRIYFSAKLLDNQGVSVPLAAEKPLCTDQAPSPAHELSLGETLVDAVATADPTMLTLVVTATDQVNGQTAMVSLPLEVIE
jgi:hypothetical protein